MKRKKNRQQDEGFFIETIDLSPSNNISPTYNNFPPPTTIDSGMSERIDEKRFFKRMGRKIKNNAIKIIAISLCVYMVFLIVGILTTNYYIDAETGTRQPVFVTYSDVAKKRDYNNLKKEMKILRDVLVDIRIVEIKLTNQQIDNNEAATKYSQLLQRIDLTIPKLQALDVGDAQLPIKESMLSCYKNYLAGYLQEMYKSLTANDAAARETAVGYRSLMFESYKAGEENLKSLGQKLKLEDDFFNWDLDKAAAEKDSTAVIKQK